MADTPNKQAKTTTVTSGSTETETATVQPASKQAYFVPEFNVTVEAASLDEAVQLASKGAEKK